MTYSCPRCHSPVKRDSNSTAAVAGGAVGALLFSAFAPLRCPICGPIRKSEFPREVQQKITRGTVGIAAGAGLLLVVVLAVIVVLSTYK